MEPLRSPLTAAVKHAAAVICTPIPAQFPKKTTLDQFPLGTKLLIDGIIYTVEDKGSGVVENHLDIYFDTHKEALDYGLQKAEVFEAVEKTQ